MGLIFILLLAVERVPCPLQPLGDGRSNLVCLIFFSISLVTVWIFKINHKEDKIAETAFSAALTTAEHFKKLSFSAHLLSIT